MRDELAGDAALEPKRYFPAEIAAAGLLIGLHLPDTLEGAVSFSLGEGGRDRQEQL